MRPSYQDAPLPVPPVANGVIIVVLGLPPVGKNTPHAEGTNGHRMSLVLVNFAQYIEIDGKKDVSNRTDVRVKFE